MPISLKQWRVQISEAEMPISLEPRRAQVGLRTQTLVASKGRKYRRTSWTTLLLPLYVLQLLLRVVRDVFRPQSPQSSKVKKGLSLLLICLMLVQMLLIMSGDVELNPGPPKKSEKPRLYELQKLTDREGSVIRVIRDVAAQWDDFAIALQFENEVATIRGNTHHRAEDACKEVFHRWLSEDPEEHHYRTPVTWNTLLEALRDCEFTVLARDLEEALNGGEKHELTEKPRLYELQKLTDREGSVIRVISDVAARWDDLAIALQFENEVATIRGNTHHRAEDACKEVFHRWLSEDPEEHHYRTPVTWNTLLEALRDCEFYLLATDLEEALNGGEKHELRTSSWEKPAVVLIIVMVLVLLICGGSYAGYQYATSLARDVPQPDLTPGSNSQQLPHTIQIHTDPSLPTDTATTCHPITDVLKLSDALAKIGDWEILCQNLRVEEAIISTLRVSRDQEVNKKRRCLKAYIDQGACWEEVIKVVANYPFYRGVLARDIAKKYGMDIDHARLLDEL